MGTEYLTHYQRLALARTKLHDSVGRLTPQILDERDYIGVIAEGEFERIVGQRMNTDLEPGGDEGYDFISPRTGKTIDVKATTRWDGRLLIKEKLKRPHADVYVLAIVNLLNETARFPGYILKEDLPRFNVEQYHGSNFYCIPQSKLRTFDFGKARR